MAWRPEKNADGIEEIVIDGWENGVAPSPYKGIGNLKNVNITSVQGEAFCNFDRQAVQGPSFSNQTVNAFLSNYLTSAPTGLRAGVWILVANSTITGFDTTHGFNGGPYYFVTNVDTSGDFQVSATYDGTPITTLGTTGTASISCTPIKNPLISSATEHISGTTPTFANYRSYMMDDTGIVYVYPYVANLISYWAAIEPPGGSTTSTNGSIVTYFGYLIRIGDIGGTTLTVQSKPTNSLGTAWSSFITPTKNTTNVPHAAIVGTFDDTIWWCSGSYVSELYQIEGQTFNPATSTTFVYDGTAISLPGSETAQCLAELGSQLVIGAASTSLYFYDRASTNATGAYTILPLVEGNVQVALTAGNVVYFFAGNKGHIYVTSGAIAQPILSLPDYIAGTPIEPYFIWKTAVFIRGRIFFSFVDSNNNAGAVWSFVPIQGMFIEEDVGSALRLENISSARTYNGYAGVILPYPGIDGQEAQGPQYWTGWTDSANSTYGIDESATTPYADGSSVIETDIVPTGTFINKTTFSRVEYKLSSPLAANESVTIKYRLNLTDSFTSCGTQITETGNVSAYYNVDFQLTQWVQLQITLTSTATSPSYCRLREVRITP